MKTLIQHLIFLPAFVLISLSLQSTVQATRAPVPLALNFTPPPLPSDRSAPGNRGEGASRGCKAEDQPLIALVPSSEQILNGVAVTQVWGLTSSDRPSFWFYVPYAPSEVSSIEFVLQTEENQTLYRAPVLLTSAGIVQVQLPSTLSALEPDKPYHWFFKVRAICEPNQAATLDYVEGWVQRTRLEPTLVNRLAQASPLQKAELYAENGIWYDALTTLAELKIAQPTDQAITQDWTELLKAVGLDDLAAQPLIR